MKYNDNGLWKTLNVKVTDTLPVGTIIPYAGATIPSNYMKCEGQELSRIEYDILFSAIGTTYGEGDGSTTFNLPNLKGRVITGIDSNDTDFDVLGETGGEKTHTLTVDEMPQHYHDYGNYIDWYTKGGMQGIISVGGSAGHTTATGGNQSHNIMQPYIVLNYIIKVLDAPAIQAQVVNGYSTSSRDSYSCNYVNNINTYSTDEIRVGTWIDGKPIYKRTFTGNSGSARANATVTIAKNQPIDVLISVEGVYQSKTTSSKSYQAFGSGTSALVYDTAGTNANNVIFFINNSSSASFDYYITLYYTKTTD